MLTKVYLEGALGKRFGREWEFEVNSPNEALRMVDANQPGVFAWIKNNLKIYEKYRVVVEYEDGRSEELTTDDYGLERRMKSIRFLPLVEGAGATARFVVGAILVIWSFFPQFGGQPWMFNMGMAMMAGSVVEMLSPRPKTAEIDRKQNEDKTSYYFNGAVNTTGQGVPVQLVYGRCMVGSHAISAAVTIDQLM